MAVLASVDATSDRCGARCTRGGAEPSRCARSCRATPHGALRRSAPAPGRRYRLCGPDCSSREYSPEQAADGRPARTSAILTGHARVAVRQTAIVVGEPGRSAESTGDPAVTGRVRLVAGDARPRDARATNEEDKTRHHGQPRTTGDQAPTTGDSWTWSRWLTRTRRTGAKPGASRVTG